MCMNDDLVQAVWLYQKATQSLPQSKLLWYGQVGTSTQPSPTETHPFMAPLHPSQTARRPMNIVQGNSLQRSRFYVSAISSMVAMYMSLTFSPLPLPHRAVSCTARVVAVWRACVRCVVPCRSTPSSSPPLMRPTTSAHSPYVP